MGSIAFIDLWCWLGPTFWQPNAWGSFLSGSTGSFMALSLVLDRTVEDDIYS
jgi:hypothetical protein